MGWFFLQNCPIHCRCLMSKFMPLNVNLVPACHPHPIIPSWPSVPLLMLCCNPHWEPVDWMKSLRCFHTKQNKDKWKCEGHKRCWNHTVEGSILNIVLFLTQKFVFNFFTDWKPPPTQTGWTWLPCKGLAVHRFCQFQWASRVLLFC